MMNLNMRRRTNNHNPFRSLDWNNWQALTHTIDGELNSTPSTIFQHGTLEKEFYFPRDLVQGGIIK
jgi:hypothetical protein